MNSKQQSLRIQFRRTSNEGKKGSKRRSIIQDSVKTKHPVNEQQIITHNALSFSKSDGKIKPSKFERKAS